MKLINFALFINYFYFCLAHRTSLFSFNINHQSNHESLDAIEAELKIPFLNFDLRADFTIDLEKTNENYIGKISIRKPSEFDILANASVNYDETQAQINSSFSCSNLNIFGKSKTILKKQSSGLIIEKWLDFNQGSDLKGQYNLTLIKNNSCPSITLFHNLTLNPKEILFFSSNVTENCYQQNDELSSEMNINITVESLLWQLVNGKLKQLFVFNKNDGWETMNATHPLADISVTGKWNKDLDVTFYKYAKLTSKIPDVIPNIEIKFVNYKDKPTRLTLSIDKFKSKSSVKTENVPKDEL